jgi:translocator protein
VRGARQARIWLPKSEREAAAEPRVAGRTGTPGYPEGVKILGKPRHLLLTTAAVGLTAALGSVGTDVSSRWYRNLDKPGWQPPAAAFPLVWTSLYAALAGSGARALDRAERHGAPARRRFLGAYGTNLALNAGWTWSFFRAKRLGLALTEILVLQASTANLTRRTWQLDRNAGIALLPYLAWTTYAGALTAELARRNRAS